MQCCLCHSSGYSALFVLEMGVRVEKIGMTGENEVKEKNEVRRLCASAICQRAEQDTQSLRQDEKRKMMSCDRWWARMTAPGERP